MVRQLERRHGRAPAEMPSRRIRPSRTRGVADSHCGTALYAHDTRATRPVTRFCRCPMNTRVDACGCALGTRRRWASTGSGPPPPSCQSPGAQPGSAPVAVRGLAGPRAVSWFALAHNSCAPWPCGPRDAAGAVSPVMGGRGGPTTPMRRYPTSSAIRRSRVDTRGFSVPVTSVIVLEACGPPDRVPRVWLTSSEPRISSSSSPGAAGACTAGRDTHVAGPMEPALRVSTQ